jgi:hypothetical protein
MGTLMFVDPAAAAEGEADADADPDGAAEPVGGAEG